MPPGHRRSYDDACAAAHALDLVGERWALLVIRELMLGPRRFSDLLRSLPGLSANVLTQRLTHLEATAIVHKHAMPQLPGVTVYDLTDWGREIEPVFQALGRWGVRSPLRGGGSFSTASLMLSLRTMFDPQLAGEFSCVIGLRTGEAELRAVLDASVLSVAPGNIDDADAILTGPPPALGTAIYGDRSLADLVSANGLEVAGDLGIAQRFCDMFRLPEAAPCPPTGR